MLAHDISIAALETIDKIVTTLGRRPRGLSKSPRHPVGRPNPTHPTIQLLVHLTSSVKPTVHLGLIRPQRTRLWNSSFVPGQRQRNRRSQHCHSSTPRSSSASVAAAALNKPNFRSSDTVRTGLTVSCTPSGRHSVGRLHVCRRNDSCIETTYLTTHEALAERRQGASRSLPMFGRSDVTTQATSEVAW